MDKKVFFGLLEQVQKPGRYLGNEWNAVKKDLENVDVKFALCFPDLYEIGMSHLGFKILYHLLNEQEGVACERVFSPGIDFQDSLRKSGFPLFSLESKKSVADFDIVGFSMAYEMCYTNILNVLSLAGIPLRANLRSSSDPLVIAGGVAAFNPEPMSEFIDLFVIGEAEEAILELIEKFKSLRGKCDRAALLKELSGIKGVYVPSLYDVEYNPDGTIKSFEPSIAPLPRVIEKRFIKNLDAAFYPVKQIVPFIKIVHDRISLEIMRGCPNKCRFCQARAVYCYKRERSASKILQLSEESQRLTGYEEISLVSLSSGDHSEIGKIIKDLVTKFEKRGVSISLPSLRIDKVLAEFPAALARLGISGITLAPEAGSERLRKIINKNIDLSHFRETTLELHKSGWRKVKLYFMIGLPGETPEDLGAIRGIVSGLKGGVNISISSFIPKPHTPFQWRAMEDPKRLREKFFSLKNSIRSRKIKLNFHDPDLSLMEGVFSRGDRKLGKVISRAFEKGAIFDGWGEHFKFDRWLASFKECGIDPHFYTHRPRSYEEILPWDHIGARLSKTHLIEESEIAGHLTKIAL